MPLSIAVTSMNAIDKPPAFLDFNLRGGGRNKQISWCMYYVSHGEKCNGDK